ncbi:uncharacterized protein LOC111867915 [Cryptotermes secundus]|uniref:uncharacterized protein LOC111867915 n=1 Tax=Cryptotermes secundus TaxID=105785 RepID=UPI000CD7BA43|nr:uncharacterized protein LOC111867915 [Cryptotermes secundus]
MEAAPILNLFLFTGILLTISCNMAEAVECYICSWNPSDYKNGNNNHDYSDVCSAGHFDPERVRTHECSRGCEIVSMKDPNGLLEMYYRNCVTNKQITHAYIKKSSKINDEEVYTCDFDLCNTANGGRHLHVVAAIALMLVLPVRWFFM